MLWNLCVFAFLAGQALSQSNYFVDLFQGQYLWAYPIDMCVPSGLLTFGYVKYTCSTDGYTVTKQNFTATDTTCSTPSVTTNYTYASMLGSGLYGFSCGGTDDYAKSKLYVASCTSPIATTTVYTAINSCFQVAALNHTAYGTLGGFEQTQCNSSTSTMQIFAAPYAICYSSHYSLLQSTLHVGTSCSLYIKSGGISVYAKLTDCVYDGYSNFAQTKNNSASLTGTKTSTREVELDIYASASSSYYSDPEVCGLDWYGWLTNYFSGNLVEITSTCDSYEGVGYPSIIIDADIYYYNSSWIETCTEIVANLTNNITGLSSSSNLNVTFTCSQLNVTTTTSATTTTTAATTTKKSSPATMMSINYLIVFAISCFVMRM